MPPLNRVATEPARITAAVVGCGPRGLEHARALREAPGIALAAVADLSEQPRREAAARFGVPAYADPQELLGEARPGIVVVATPPNVRGALVERAAAAEGVAAIVVEKPMAMTVAEAESMVSTCDRRSVLLAVCHQLRFVSSFVAMREAIAAGELGSLEFLRGAAFGDLLDQGPHLLDAMRWVSGERRVLWAMSQRGDAALRRVPGAPAANGWIPAWTTHYLAFEGGLRGSLETGPLHQRGRDFVDEFLDKRLTVFGTEGVGHCTATGNCLILNGEGRTRDLARREIGAYEAATTAFHEEVRDAILEGRGHRAGGHDALATIEGILACAQSAARGDAAVLPLARDENPIAELIERTPATLPPPGGVAVQAPKHVVTPDVTVIIPLPDHRGHAPKCVESWVNGQTLARERFELVLVADGAEPELEEELEAMLGPGDRLLRVDGAPEIVLYDAGARAARGALLLITEPHCTAEPDCLEELLGFFVRSDFDGAACRSVGIAPNALARMEQRLFEEGFREWSRPEHWCKVILRGFAVTREAYGELGGFDVGYGRFAEFAFALALHAGGHRVGYASGAAINHAYSTRFKNVVPAIDDFARGEMAYFIDHPAELCGRYFGAPREWVDRRHLDRDAARAACWLALRSTASVAAWRDGSARAMAGELRRSLPTAVFGPQARILRANALYWIARGRCVLWRWRDARLETAYRDVWGRIVSRARIAFLAEHAGRAEPMSHSRRFSIAELPDERLYGFHARERLDGKAFRWSGPVAFADLPLPRGSYRGRIGTCIQASPEGLRVFFNGNRLPPESVSIERHGISLTIEPQLFCDRSEQRLAITCRSLRPSRHGNSEDERELGLAIAGIDFEDAVPSPDEPVI